MAIGPVEYIIVGFPGDQFNGDIAPELGLTQPQHTKRRTVMLRRRPVARAAVTTSVVVGTAARTANRVDRRQDRCGR
jgi:hypothetical protein